jgi:polar amino acid transport system substrate-binding protein
MMQDEISVRKRAGRPKKLAAYGIAMVAVAALAGCSAASPAPAPSKTASDSAKLNVTLPASIASSKQISIGLDPTYPPLESLAADGKTVVGANVDLLNAAAKKLGVTIKYVPTAFVGELAGLSAGHFDAGLVYSDSASREAGGFDLVDYLSVGNAYVVKSTDKSFGKKPELPCGESVGVNTGNVGVQIAPVSSQQCVSAGKKPFNIVTFPAADSLPTALSSNRVDSILNSTIYDGYLVKQSKGTLKILGGQIQQVPYGLVITKANPIGPVLVKALQSLVDDGSYQKILDKYGIGDVAVKTVGLNLGAKD